MQGQHDIWNTTEVHRAIRRRIGEALSAGYDLSKPLPDRMHTLLEQLDEPSPGTLSGHQAGGRAQMPAVRAATLRKF
jgi:hypothetical protein